MLMDLTDESVIQEISDITGVKYSDEQRKILMHKGGMCILACAGSGKALINGTRVLTPRGYIKIEELKVGDIIYGANGLHQVVQGVFPQGKKRVYEVRFADESLAQCCKEHLWTFKVMSDSKSFESIPWKTATLGEITGNFSTQIRNREIVTPLNSAIQFEKKEHVLEADSVVQNVFNASGFAGVPDDYTYSSVADRESILDAFIKYSGEESEDYITIGVHEKGVCDTVKFIAQSLGMVATHRVDTRSEDTRYTVNILKNIKYRRIRSIKETSVDAEMTCIKVSNADGLFVIDNCIVTHNTTVLTHLLAKRIKTGEIQNTKKLLCTTFSKAGSVEMETRLEKLLKRLNIKTKVEVRTLHSSYFLVLKHFGVVSNNVCSNAQRSAFVMQAVKESGVQIEDEDLQLIDSLLSYQVNNLLDDQSLVKSYVYTLDDLPLEKYSEIRRRYGEKKQGAGVIDFDDMQMYMYTLLVYQARPDVLEFCRNMWEYFFVDEFQDVSKIQFAILRSLITSADKLIVIGDDDQSLVEQTEIIRGNEIVTIDKIKTGDTVLCGSGFGESGEFEVRAINKKEYSGNIVVIKTKSGKTIKGTPGHIGFARLTPSEDYVYNYIMYRHGYGYRTGIVHGRRSNNFGEDNVGLAQRVMQEHADKAWIIYTNASMEEALKKEKNIAEVYRIPTCRFEADYKEWKTKAELSCERADIKETFKMLDTEEASRVLMEDFGIDIDYPHYVTQADGDRFRISYTLLGHSEKYKTGIHPSIVSARTSNEKLGSILSEHMRVSEKTAKSGYKYKEARAFGVDEARLGNIVKEVLTEGRLQDMYIEDIKNAKLTKEGQKFMPFGNMHPGMEVPSYIDGKIVDDLIISVSREHYNGFVYDLDVPGVRNFIADGVSVHNCIYQWRGADPSIILNICGFYDIQNFVLSTNYRCGGEIVEHAAVCIKNNEKRADKDMVPFNKGGKIKICDAGSSNMYTMSKYAFTYIMQLVTEKHVDPESIAVLCRNNLHLAILNNMLFKSGVYSESSPEMKMTNMSMYKDIKSVLEMANNTFNHNIVGKNLWKMVSYLGIKGARIFYDFMNETGCNLKDAIGYIISNYAGRGSSIDWTGRIRVPERISDKIEYRYAAVKRESEDGLIMLYKALELEDESEKIAVMLELYIAATEFMHKSGDKSRTVNGLVDYVKKLIKEDGLDNTRSWLATTEQYESGKAIIPGAKMTMSTMHGAKGREWPNVILFAVDNVTFPSFEGINTMIMDNIERTDISGSIDENRRLAYVGMTRAKEELVIFTDKMNMSVYLLEALGVLKKDGYEKNAHIIRMALDGGVTIDITRLAEEKIFTEDSPYLLKVDVKDNINRPTFIEAGDPDAEDFMEEEFMGKF